MVGDDRRDRPARARGERLEARGTSAQAPRASPSPRFIPCLAVPFSVQLGLFFALLTALGLDRRLLPQAQGRRPGAAGRVAAAAPQHDRAVPLADLHARLRRGHDVVGLPRAALGARADQRRAGGDRRRPRAGHGRRRPRLRPLGHAPRVDRRRADRRRPRVPRRDARGHGGRRALRLRRRRCFYVDDRRRDARRACSLASRSTSGPALAVSAGLLWAGLGHHDQGAERARPTSASSAWSCTRSRSSSSCSVARRRC